MNPLKCAFGVTSGIFLGFVAEDSFIEIDQAKMKTIWDIPLPKNLKALRDLQGAWHTFEDSSQISALPCFYPPYEEGCTFQMGWLMSEGSWKYQKVCIESSNVGGISS